MNPTLREPEIIEILPYDGRRVRAGDVVFLLPREADHAVVHRVVRVTPAGISTQGDNNAEEDALLLQPSDIEGQVVAAWRGQRRRVIAGGPTGRLTKRWLRPQAVIDGGMSRLFHPLYEALSRWGVIARLLPASLQPRVVLFQAQGLEEFRLLLGGRVIGRYDGRKRQWRIQRPFRLLVDERVLPRQQQKDRAGLA